ncbi:cytidine deaminase [Acidithiobacillus thiooxidans]|uniref:cytidine deaminase n=1 Tax=Acidithiobacillus thiooxidans TaxID=930 RepID=UPI001D0316A1|nr:cytidine deaminase [Acidithiobacillus thiooxidans]
MNGPDTKMNLPEATIAQLRRSAEAALKNAYVPYSHFSVGAAILTTSGRIFNGCNVENAAYPSGLCAEAVAIGHMVATLGPMHILACYVACKGHTPAWPCGSCRQRLNEFADTRMWVLTSVMDGLPERIPFRDLLPHHFGAADLEGFRS